MRLRGPGLRRRRTRRGDPAPRRGGARHLVLARARSQARAGSDADGRRRRRHRKGDAMNALKRALVIALVIGAASGTAYAASPGPHFGPWSTAQKIDEINGNDPDLNTPSQDGCPIQSPDGLKLYIATNRPGGHGGLDIWMASRPSKDDSWGAAVDLP